MNKTRRLFTLCIALLVALSLTAQTEEPEAEVPPVQYEATQTDYGFFGTTDALFSKSETIICTFALTQNTPKGDKIYPTMLSIWLHADALATKSQEQTVKLIAQAGERLVDGQFRHPATLLLDNNEEIELNFSINNLTDDYSHYTVMLTAPVSAPGSSTAMYGEVATKLRRHDIVSIAIAGVKLNLRLLGFTTAEYLNGICKELMLAGCDTESFVALDSRDADDFDVSLFRQSGREKSLDELVFHALGCFPSDISNLRPATAVEIIRKNTDWIIDDNPDFSELEFTQADGYDYTYHGIRIGAEMCWTEQQLTGYNYYFKLYSKEKQMVKAAYHRLKDELEVLGFELKQRKGEKGDKDPQQGSTGGYSVETTYYLNVNDEYVIQLKVKPEKSNE